MTDHTEPDWPVHLRSWDPAQFPDRTDWHAARFHFAPQCTEELGAIAWLSRADASKTGNEENSDDDR